MPSLAASITCQLLLIGLLGLSGCSLIPDYQRPPLPVPAHQGLWQRQDAAPAVGVDLSPDERQLLAAVSAEALLPELVGQAQIGRAHV